MMTKLIFVRHGQSEANEQGIFAGQADVPLTALGRRQAAELAAFVLREYAVDAVYSSDLQRARGTVCAIAEALRLPVAAERSLREIDGGAWDGKKIEEVARLYPADYALWRSDIGLSRCTGGESVAQLQARAVSAAARIAAANEGKTVLIATHACFLRAMQCYWQRLPLGAMKNVPWVPNASVTEVDYSAGSQRIVRLGEASFLGGDVTRLPSDI